MEGPLPVSHPTTNRSPLGLAQALIRCPTVTPEEGGALAFLGETLSAAGFHVERPTFSEAGTPDIENLYARFGTGAPYLLFAGHTDVVPPGDAASWRHGPFEGAVENGLLYGRGAVDMKGGIACMLAAALDFVDRRGPAFAGSIGLRGPPPPDPPPPGPDDTRSVSGSLGTGPCGCVRESV